MKIPSQHIQEHLSKAYLQALVVSAGQIINFSGMDYGTDCTISAATFEEEISAIPLLDIQLKATCAPRVVKDNFVYDLEMKAVRFLMVKASVKRAVLVLIQPKEQKDWVQHSEEHLAIKNLLFWIDSEMLPKKEITNSTTLAIELPKDRIFSEITIKKLIADLDKNTEASHVF